MLEKENISQLIANIKKNEAIATKLFDIETSILSTHNFSELFDNLLKLIEDKFNVPHVWLSVTKSNRVARILKEADTSDYVKARLNLVEQEAFDVITRCSSKPILANDSMFYYHQLLPETCTWELGSIAIAPLVYDGKVVGSLNQGDSSKERFTPDLDTFFLTQLATKVSICLANVSAQEQLRILATRDPLTHLLNRRELSNMLDKEFARSNRDHTPLSIIFIDCDDFKAVNDEYGHECGDEYLVYIAEQMNNTVRQGDSTFRYAGDEFVILLPGQSSTEAEIVATRLRTSLQSNPFNYTNTEIEAKISFGIASTEDTGASSPEKLLKYADEKLYLDKARKHTRSAPNTNSLVR